MILEVVSQDKLLEAGLGRCILAEQGRCILAELLQIERQKSSSCSQGGFFSNISFLGQGFMAPSVV